MRYFCRIIYDGTRFGGWQRQPDEPSVQQLLEECAQVVLRSPVSFTGAGRTDAGVHAAAQGAHFDYDGIIEPRRFIHSLNALLPPEVAIHDVRKVAPDFHARYSALRRTYRYCITTRKSPLLARRAWPVTFDVDWGMVTVQIPALLGEHDFSAFCASGSGSATALCTVYATSLGQERECMVFSIEANRFVYKMVRSIVGTLVDIGRGRLRSTLGEILDSRDRSQTGTTAPPFGLTLDNVTYSEVE